MRYCLGDTREVTILTDDERPFVQYGEKTQTSEGSGEGGGKP